MKKVIGIVWFFVLMLLLLITGCTEKENDINSGNGEVSDEPSDVTSDVTSDNEAGEVEHRGSITSSVYDRGTIPPEIGTITNNHIVDWINQNGPTDVSYVAIPRWESKEKLNLLFASDDAPDLIFEFFQPIRNQLYSQGLLMPVDEMIEKYSTTYKAILEENPNLKAAATKTDGKMYEFLRILPPKPNHTLFIRTDWLDNLGLEMPTTIEQFIEVARAFAFDDPDGNGIDDTYGYNLSFIGAYIADAMFNNYMYAIEDDGIVANWESAEAALEFKKQLYDEGIVDRDFALDKNGEKALQDFLNGKLGIYGSFLNYNGIIDPFIENNPEAKIDLMPLPSTSVGTYGPVVDRRLNGLAIVNAQAKDPEAIMKYIDFIIQESTQTYLAYGTEGETYELIDGFPVTDITPEMQEKWNLEHSWAIDFMNIGTPVSYEAEFYNVRKLSPNLENYEVKQKLLDQAFKYYIDNTGVINLHLDPYFPAVPEELVQASVDIAAIQDIFLQSVLTGKSFPVEKAINDAKELWSISGGDDLVEYYSSWYKENKGNIYLPADNY